MASDHRTRRLDTEHDRRYGGRTQVPPAGPPSAGQWPPAGQPQAGPRRMGPPPQAGPPRSGPRPAPAGPPRGPRQADPGQPRAPWPAQPPPSDPSPAEPAQYGATGHAPAAAGSGRSFNVTKLMAGGLAASSSAVCGSYFGLLGTVGGAAAGSVATALSTEIYQRFLEHARDRIRPGGPRTAPGRSAAAPAGHDQHDQYQQEQHEPPRRRWLPRLVVVSLVLFALAMAAVSGIEAVRGEPLSGGSKGTSVGHLLGGGGLGSTVDGLLGGGNNGSGASDDKSGKDGDRGNDHGLVGGLLGGLSGN